MSGGSPTIICRGYLNKQGAFNKAFQKRFFVLLSNGELRYFERAKSARAKGVIKMHDAVSVQLTERKQRGKLRTDAIEISMRGTRRVFVLTGDDIHLWFTNLKSSIEGLFESGTR
ncbi:hypothetical protein KIPB_013770 [Kipferlia bialata]|uniref:PH domain-containing protein n=1 Tax=Kipferlia bialata TaxID=797122 RepID=A0A9K3D8G3_9EUKA|nr:hypothetical protein KIPB_013770 [Kipferlia bialata]|eukprot:g13770.t1